MPTFGARRFPKGNEGKRVSSGYNRRRRLATRSSGKQQAERTAVRTAPIVCPEESPLVRPQAHTPCPGWSLTRRLRRGRWGCRPEGGSTFFRSERKYQRKHAARRLRRRPAPLRVAGFGLREPNGWMPRIYSGHPIPALRPEQSDHVPWADCPQGLSSTLVRFAHPSGKKPLIAHFDSGARNVARNGIGQLSPARGARSCSPFSAVKMGGPFSLRCLSPLCSPAADAGQTRPVQVGMSLLA